jgi:4-oxalocrotonate tautomerase
VGTGLREARFGGRSKVGQDHAQKNDRLVARRDGWQIVCRHHERKSAMPYVNIKITREGATPAQKAELIHGVTDLLVKVLNKNPATTVVVIDEVAMEDWGIGGLPVTEYRKQAAAKKT